MYPYNFPKKTEQNSAATEGDCKINTHFPEDRMWFLLDSPVPHQTYSL